MDLGLRGKKAIVTGATRGIGRAIVELLAAEGADIGFCARNEDEITETTAALQGARRQRDRLRRQRARRRRLQGLAREDGDRPRRLRRLRRQRQCRRRHGQRKELVEELRDRRPAHRARLRNADGAPQEVRPGLGRHHQLDQRDRDLRRADGLQRHEGRADHLLEAAVAVRRQGQRARELALPRARSTSKAAPGK